MKYLDMLDCISGWAALTATPPSGFLLYPANEEHLEKIRGRKGSQGTYYLFPYGIVTNCLHPPKTPNRCLTILLFLAQVLHCPLWLPQALVNRPSTKLF